ncbi:hypothetical protein QC762_0099480 [Podospora pseudocomata]|uniref:Uncharacterized protein n=1 Tax=Podospora pseudocomata TaxID=2093779 RepID=A0ABR0G8R0_9PEZI|nr:hypothetical protein QC762_0099480 [Podospora pseudocomata]
MDASQKSSLKYVSSGSSQSVSPNGHLISNTFIPLDILNTRLCGDWQARQQAYTRDWLAFCFYIVDVEANKPHNQRRSTKDLLPNELLKLFEKDQDAAGLANILRPDWNGAHLGARNSVGEFSTIGAKFLYELLFDKDLKLMSASSLARHIFKRWCLVAHSAASLAKEPFSVKARFWKIPRLPNVNNSLELVYVLLPEFWSWTETVDHGIMEDQTISADLKTTIRRISRDDEYRRQADELWGDFMTRAFAKAASNTAQPITARLALPTDNVQNMVLLGSHPQGYYSTYIQPQDLELLRSHGYTWGGDHHPFPRHMQPHEIVSLSESTTLSVTGVYECKTTVISKMNIQNASNWPRIRTQNAVMDNISANQVSYICVWSCRHG